MKCVTNVPQRKSRYNHHLTQVWAKKKDIFSRPNFKQKVKNNNFRFCFRFYVGWISETHRFEMVGV
jgi:hypothetical protein